jgi:hypothetical protein
MSTVQLFAYAEGSIPRIRAPRRSDIRYVLNVPWTHLAVVFSYFATWPASAEARCLVANLLQC